MFQRLTAWSAVVWLLTMTATLAVEPAILDAAAVPNLSAPGRAVYGNFLPMNHPRVYAVGTDSHYGWFRGAGTIEDARLWWQCAGWAGARS